MSPWIWIVIGVAICGIGVAVVHNLRNHPGKVQQQLQDAETKVEDLRK